jgi:hypothetical protein
MHTAKPTVEKVLEILENISNDINSQINYPNNGGCCVIASLVGEQLELLGVETEIVTNNSYKLTPRQVFALVGPKTRFTNPFEENGVDFNHVGVRFKLGRKIYTFDSDGVYGARVFSQKQDKIKYRFGQGLPVFAAKSLASQRQNWNFKFNRRQIPLLRKIIKRNFYELVGDY